MGVGRWALEEAGALGAGRWHGRRMGGRRWAGGDRRSRGRRDGGSGDPHDVQPQRRQRGRFVAARHHAEAGARHRQQHGRDTGGGDRDAGVLRHGGRRTVQLTSDSGRRAQQASQTADVEHDEVVGMRLEPGREVARQVHQPLSRRRRPIGRGHPFRRRGGLRLIDARDVHARIQRPGPDRVLDRRARGRLGTRPTSNSDLTRRTTPRWLPSTSLMGGSRSS